MHKNTYRWCSYHVSVGSRSRHLGRSRLAWSVPEDLSQSMEVGILHALVSQLPKTLSLALLPKTHFCVPKHGGPCITAATIVPVKVDTYSTPLTRLLWLHMRSKIHVQIFQTTAMASFISRLWLILRYCFLLQHHRLVGLPLQNLRKRRDAQRHGPENIAKHSMSIVP